MGRRIVVLFILGLLTVFARTRVVHAQEGGDDYRFQPPPPPVIDGNDYDDGSDDGTPEMGDDGGYRPPPAFMNDSADRPNVPPPNDQQGNEAMGRFSPPRPAPSYGSGGAGSNFGKTEGKLHFQIVDGQYWRKGQKRQRGKEIHSDSSSSFPGGAE